MSKEARFRLLLLTFPLFAMLACNQQPTDAPQGMVTANHAYLAYFGEPPEVKQGQGFARVGFYPLKQDKTKVRPVPLFLFREADQLPLLLERLVSSENPFSEQGPLFNPFPPGSSVRLLSRSRGVVALELVLKQPPVTENIPAIVGALTETAAQFDDIDKVIISVSGQPLAAMPEEGYVHDDARIFPPASPELLLVVGSWEKDAKDPREIQADFDRPVKIESFALEAASGQKIQGKYFTSAFDMAVVIQPEDPSSIKAGMSVRAEWTVIDRLGRKGQGTRVFSLERHDHTDGF